MDYPDFILGDIYGFFDNVTTHTNSTNDEKPGLLFWVGVFFSRLWSHYIVNRGNLFGSVDRLNFWKGVGCEYAIKSLPCSVANRDSCRNCLSKAFLYNGTKKFFYTRFHVLWQKLLALLGQRDG
jgi:hypothetical protein